MAQYSAVPTSEEAADFHQSSSGNAPTSTFSFDEKPLSSAQTRVQKCVAWCRNNARSFLPSYCQASRGGTGRKLRSTAYLDALRGYASVFVYFVHVFPSTDQTNWRFIPFVSTMFSGRGMVALFFVISGYALCYSLLLSMYKQDEGHLLNSLASSTFRRFTRLYGSTAVALLIAFAMLRLQLYDGMWSRDIYMDSFFEQFVDVLRDIWYSSNPFGNIHDLDIGISAKYLPQTWTIPVEYRGSVMLFAFCTAFCKVSPRTRMAFTWLVIFAGFAWQTVYVSNFMFGLFIADLAIYRQQRHGLLAGTLPTSTTTLPDTDTPPPQSQSLRSKTLHTLLLLTGLYLLGQPWADDSLLFLNYPWPYLKSFARWYWNRYDVHTFWYGWGGFATVYALEFYPALQRPLLARFSQYLGHISFGIYLMHVPFGLGVKRIYLDVWRAEILGDGNLALFVVFLLTTAIVFTAGDYFTMLDAKVVRFARWLQGRVFVTWPTRH
ncbi:hypothetical protein LTR84_006532 [Exophiala bonariae]|uniref:Acyltransferase 3 domain-containing protein n=1 Tax=Exophiala bonariae TaxID=1690606 RepID=A0AAV9N0D2_9EURO|nr:hypothetical protein LTR84_006532 [Exophiala bonariae]